MAKSSRVSVSSGSGVSLSKLRSLCTAAERKLLEMSESTGISKAAHAEVHALMTRARSARDKWRAMVGQQTRVVKRSPKAVAEANARSHAKAELFGGDLRRAVGRQFTDRPHEDAEAGPRHRPPRIASGRSQGTFPSTRRAQPGGCEAGRGQGEACRVEAGRCCGRPGGCEGGCEGDHHVEDRIEDDIEEAEARPSQGCGAGGPFRRRKAAIGSDGRQELPPEDGRVSDPSGKSHDRLRQAFAGPPRQAAVGGCAHEPVGWGWNWPYNASHGCCSIHN